MERTAAALGTAASETRRRAHRRTLKRGSGARFGAGFGQEESDGGKWLGGETQLRRGITHCAERETERERVGENPYLDAKRLRGLSTSG